MLTVFEVRNEVSEIARSDWHPIRKARRLIQVSRDIRRHADQMGMGAKMLSRDTLDDEADRMERRVLRLARLNSEVLDLARRVLARHKKAERNKNGDQTRTPS